MQTQSILNQSQNPLQPPKSAPLPNDDFRRALALEVDRQPVCAAPDQPAPTQAQSRAPKTAQPAKPAQQPQNTQNTQNAQNSQDASQASGTDAAAGAGETAAADGKPAAQAGQPSGEQDEVPDTPVADAAAGMLAMLAAYGQLTARPEPVADSATPDSAGLSALQPEMGGKAGKATLADLAADAQGTDGTSALQDALSEQAGADRMLKAGNGLALGSDQKAQGFAEKLAANAAASLADAAPAAQPVAAPAAQALAATVQAANMVATSQLQARVGSSAWEQQLGQKVVWMVAGGDQSASLTLNPPDLGPLQVVLNVSNDSATATFTAHQAETRQAIENALPKLREMMSEAGIMLGDASVSAGTQEQQQAFAEQARGSGNGGGGRPGNGDGAGSHDEAQPVIRRTVLGAVDTFA
jgi:flagellar hook-length control protein FliK